LAEASGRSYEVEVVSFGGSARRVELSPGVTLRILADFRGPAPGPTGLTYAFDSLSWELIDAVASADLVHVHQPFTRCGEFAIWLARLEGKPLCVTDHGGVSTWLGFRFGMLGLADRIVPISEFAGDVMRDRILGASPDPGRTAVPQFTVVRGGVDASFFAPPDGRVERDRVLFVGRVLPHKGIDRLIQALPDGLPLTVYGCPYDREYLGYLKWLARRKDVEFAFTPAAEGGDEVMRSLYRRAWVNVLPSVYRDCRGNHYVEPEHMGFTLLESMACGTPAACSRVGGMPEFVRDGETGFVFDGVSELSGLLRTLAADPALVERMGRRARAVVEAEYDLRAVGAKLLGLYDTLLGRGAAGGPSARLSA
jgi:glycosyltransferase involved in cell wall biosynthesis